MEWKYLLLFCLCALKLLVEAFYIFLCYQKALFKCCQTISIILNLLTVLSQKLYFGVLLIHVFEFLKVFLRLLYFDFKQVENVFDCVWCDSKTLMLIFGDKIVENFSNLTYGTYFVIMLVCVLQAIDKALCIFLHRTFHISIC